MIIVMIITIVVNIEMVKMVDEGWHDDVVDDVDYVKDVSNFIFSSFLFLTFLRRFLTFSDTLLLTLLLSRRFSGTLTLLSNKRK